MKNSLILKLSATAVLFLVIGFFVGKEYTAYQVGKAVQEAFGEPTEPTKTVMEEIKQEKGKVIEAKVGEEIKLSTINLKVNSSKEETILNKTYDSPAVATQGSKFVVIDLNVTNTTKAEFDFDPDFPLVDNKDREFSENSIGLIDSYIIYRTLSPNIAENGFIVYEVPNDAESYSLLIGKAGTDEYYKIKLK